MADQSPEIRVDEAVDQPTIAIRTVVPMAELDIGALFSQSMGRIAEHVERVAAARSGPPYARYYEFGGENADVEVGTPVESTGDLASLDSTPGGEIGATVLPGGPRGVALHVGDYGQLGDAYKRLEHWMQEAGRTPRGAPWEFYVVMPDTAGGDPSRLRTELCWPIE